MEDRTVVAHGCRITKKKLICGMEGKMLWLMAAHAFPRSLYCWKWNNLLEILKSVI